jgi:hypothetical protein
MSLSEEVTKYCDKVRGVEKQGDLGTLCPGRCQLRSTCRKSPSYPLSWELMIAWHNKMNSEFELLKKQGVIK